MHRVNQLLPHFCILLILPRHPKIPLVALRSSSPSSPNHALPSIVIELPALCRIVPAPPGVPHRLAILVLPGQEIPFGRPYHTQPNGVLRMITERKRVHPIPAHISVNHRRFHSSSLSLPRKRRRTSSCSSSSEGSSPNLSTSLSERSSHSVTTHSPSPSAGPSCKRCRSPTTLVTLATFTPRALVHVRADLFPPRKRIRGSSAALSLEDTIKESLEVGSEEDIDLDVMADIEADIAAKAAAADEIRAETEIRVDRVFDPGITSDSLIPASGRGSREDFEIGLDVVIQELYDHIEEIPAQKIAKVEEEGDLAEERERADSLRRHLSYVHDELRQIRSSRYYDKMDFRRLETFAMRRLGYRP
ncbi:hypothetical protein Tco_1088565 [Tanacetum coccineum]